MAGVKRSLQEAFEDVASVDKSCSSASVVGIPTSLSPLKKNKHNSDYFQAKLIDGKKQITLWGNVEKQREQLKTYESTKSAVKISDCEV